MTRKDKIRFYFKNLWRAITGQTGFYLGNFKDSNQEDLMVDSLVQELRSILAQIDIYIYGQETSRYYSGDTEKLAKLYEFLKEKTKEANDHIYLHLGIKK